MADTFGGSGRALPPDLGRYRTMMRGWARKAGAAADDASDVVQEAMLKAVKHQDRLATLNDKQLPAWLKTTTRRKALDAERHRRRSKRGNGSLCSLDELLHEEGRHHGRQEATEPLADDTSPSKQAELRELREQLLKQLPQEEREVCRLILWEKWSADQVADHLGLPRDEVGLKAGGGLMRLRQMLKRPTKVRDARGTE
jgi:RNA polymerase sigma factor (sigma-70 family)